ncbi:MAG: hypothetical protein J3K34DRAFT_524407 [Monoraphidium minutum]|nr:MAG: hypothetical protein J3K34DRAFT_524407 [Monoraphidium minutum]
MSPSRSAVAGVLLALAFASAAHAGAANIKPWLCPPKQFDSVANFDLAKFIAAPWYVQNQTVLKYQPKQNLFCVRAKYIPIDPKNLSKGIRVCNFANGGAINKAAMGTCLAKGVKPPAGQPPSFEMQGLPWPARRSDPATAASKLVVGPANLLATKSAEELVKPPPPGAPRLAGPYWVVAVGKSKNAAVGYDWAIVSGGAPSQATINDACIPPTKSDDGLWLFTRAPVPPKADVTAMTAAAKALRLDLKALAPVVQAGCTYAGAA